ncbi:hypothetical protein CLW00_10347 [Mongoliibacter ruber]|uniref:Uncharacterized protein n=1 Tax=Mongoliibacter ruber TaxID=1750599 RepID=A0A2T0WQG6_9BACT|nr:hypothetical protein CLW00_10347 [Mongoliibacter ruber]
MLKLKSNMYIHNCTSNYEQFVFFIQIFFDTGSDSVNKFSIDT